jgi:hypothetical protein
MEFFFLPLFKKLLVVQFGNSAAFSNCIENSAGGSELIARIYCASVLNCLSTIIASG